MSSSIKIMAAFNFIWPIHTAESLRTCLEPSCFFQIGILVVVLHDTQFIENSTKIVGPMSVYRDSMNHYRCAIPYNSWFRAHCHVEIADRNIIMYHYTKDVDITFIMYIIFFCIVNCCILKLVTGCCS